MLDPYTDTVAPDLIDSSPKARQAGELFTRENADIVLAFPFGYTPSMNIVPALADLTVPVRLLNAHEGGISRE